MHILHRLMDLDCSIKGDSISMSHYGTPVCIFFTEILERALWWVRVRPMTHLIGMQRWWWWWSVGLRVRMHVGVWFGCRWGSIVRSTVARMHRVVTHGVDRSMGRRAVGWILEWVLRWRTEIDWVYVRSRTIWSRWYSIWSFSTFCIINLLPFLSLRFYRLCHFSQHLFPFFSGTGVSLLPPAEEFFRWLTIGFWVVFCFVP